MHKNSRPNRAFSLVPAAPAAAAVAVAVASLVGLSSAATADLNVNGFDYLRQETTFGFVPEADDVFGTAVAAGDFDGDGFDDLAVGLPREDIGLSGQDQGLVAVYSGSLDGLITDIARTYILPADSTCTNSDARFGSSLAAGDFNGDGYDDLAVGAPDDVIPAFTSTCVDAGSVTVFDGSPEGLDASQRILLRHETGQNAGTLANDEDFGAALAVGDFNGDGFDDLASGGPGDQIGAASGAGSVLVSFGKSSGLTYGDSQYWHKDVVGMESHQNRGAFEDDRFGASLAAGDVNGDLVDDLLIGVPLDDFTELNTGSHHLLFAEAGTGLVVAGNFREVQFSPVVGIAAGTSVAMADTDGDGLSDLWVGRPGMPVDFKTPESEGTIYSLQATGDPSAPFGCYFESTQPIQLGGPEPFDSFGEVMAVGDFDLDGKDDVVVGVPRENLRDDEADPAFDAGAVNILRGNGTPSCATATRWQIWTLDSPGVLGGSDDNDRFGAAVAVGDFDGGGGDDLAIGVPWRDGDADDTGAVLVLYNQLSPSRILYDDFERGDTSAWSSLGP